LPTASKSYCTVESNEIVSLQVDGVNNIGAVFFEDEMSCSGACVWISIDPCKVEQDITFRIESTFSNSNTALI